MKTRVIHTKFWSDSYVKKLSDKETLFYLWLILNQHIDVLNIIQISDESLAQQAKIELEELPAVKEKFQNDGKIIFFKDYIYVCNGYKYQYYGGIKNAYPKLRTIFEMSNDVLIHFGEQVGFWIEEIKSDIEPYIKDDKYSKVITLLKRVLNRYQYYVNTHNDSPKYTPIDTEQNTEIRNKNTETQIQNTEPKSLKDKLANLQGRRA